MALHQLSPGDSLQKALSGAKKGDVLRLAPGEYREKVVLDVPGVTVDGGGEAVLAWADGAKHIASDGLETNTFRSYTLHVIAPDVTLRGLTVRNDAGDPKLHGQCVSLSVTADRFLAEDCRFLSTQDTLFCGPLPDDLIVRYIDFLPERERYMEGRGRQMFRGCYIAGSVDFIFGCGEAVFDRCTLHSVDDGRPAGYVAAPAHSLKQERGFLFTDCDFTGDAGLEGCVYLARPWRDFGKAVFRRCRYGRHIHPAGFHPWNDTQRHRTARFLYERVPGTEGFVPWAKVLRGEEEVWR